MPLISVTDNVLNDERSKLAREEQNVNIEDMFVTFDVLNDERSSSASDEHP